MSRATFRVLAVLALITPSQARAGSWSLGSHLGVATIHGDVSGSGTSTVLAWPTNALAYQPALRVGFGDSPHAHELLMDTGLFLLDEAGSTLSLFVASASYQHTCLPSWANSLFANVGMGLYREGSATRHSTARSYGGGLGFRHVVRERHGALRAEVRADHLDSDAGSGRPSLTTLELRLGFDLWL